MEQVERRSETEGCRQNAELVPSPSREVQHKDFEIMRDSHRKHEVRRSCNKGKMVKTAQGKSKGTCL